MAKLSLLISLIALLLISCQEEGNTLNNSNISPKVKVESKYWVNKENSNDSYVIYRKEFDQSGNLVEYREFRQSGEVQTRSTFTYNQFESYEEKHTFDEDGEVSSVGSFVYIFETNGRLKEKHHIDQNGNIASKEVYDYDVNGNVTKKLYFNHSTGLSNSIDYTYKYSPDGRIVERIITEEGNESRRDSIVSRKNDNRLEVFNYDINGNIILVKTYYYNQFGLISMEIEADSKGNIQRKFAYRYEFFN